MTVSQVFYPNEINKPAAKTAAGKHYRRLTSVLNDVRNPTGPAFCIGLIESKARLTRNGELQVRQAG